MAHRIYICRTDRPEHAADAPISLDEWTAVVRDIPEMHLFEGQQALPPHVAAPEPSDGLARWAGHPRFESIWFHYDDGVIYVEGYDAYVNMRMRVLANRLNATVMDKNGRTF